MQKVLKYKKLEVILKMVFMHIQFCQERRISMDEKLLEIYKNSGVNKYVNVKLKDGRSIKCTADCFCTIGDDEDEDDVEKVII